MAWIKIDFFFRNIKKICPRGFFLLHICREKLNVKSEVTMRWVLLAAGIMAELGGSVCMKLSDGFNNLLPSVLTFIFWGISFTVFIFALKHFDLSFAYAVWAGLGILFIALTGIIYFGEPVTALKIISILIIVAGVILLNLSEYLIEK